MDEPTITRAEAEALFAAEGTGTNLMFAQAINGLFLVRNHGVSDDGKGVILSVVARVIDAPAGATRISRDNTTL